MHARRFPARGLAPKGSLWIGNGVQNLAAGVVLLLFAFTLSDVGDIVPGALSASTSKSGIDGERSSGARHISGDASRRGVAAIEQRDTHEFTSHYPDRRPDRAD
jgi:hypothetical protein